MPFPRGRNHIDNGQFDRPEKVFGATGGASLYRISMLEDIGLFDERFFAYYEDVDVSFRAHLAGWDVFYEPRAVAYHNVSATSSKLGNFTRYHATKNFFMLYIKNMPGILFWKYLPYFVLQGLLLGGSSTLKGKIITYVKGFCGFAVNIPAVLMERHRIQKYRQTSISEIDALLYKRRPPGTPKL